MPRRSTRDEILAVAAAQFAHVGFKGASLQEIAAEVGCSKATLLYHFAGKDAILAALIAPAARELAALDARLAGLDARAARAAAIEGFVDLVLRHRQEAGLIYSDAARFLQEPVFAHLRPLIENLCSALAGRSSDPADCIAAEVVLGGIAGVVIDKAGEDMRDALVAVAERALITPNDKD
ncbi:helix-turn-helix domain-containing protein [Actinoplanes sp. NPDC026623]|uniref:TetR/AcrR family transcriptional regulator n=1 Tax=Actinoplanes sp. NPDC026623 TaxID=3155610 RepID=UPI0033EE9AD0